MQSGALAEDEVEGRAEHERNRAALPKRDPRSALDGRVKKNELEHVLNHNATMKQLADTTQQGQYHATEIATSLLASVLVGYLIKKHVMPGQGGARAK